MLKKKCNVVFLMEDNTETKNFEDPTKNICHTCNGVLFKHNVYFSLKTVIKTEFFVWLSQSTSALQHWLHKCQYGILSVQCSPVQLRTVCPLLIATCPPTSYFTMEISLRNQTINSSFQVLS